MGGDLLPQHQQALRRRIAGEFPGQRLHRPRCTARPRLDRKQVRRRQPARQQQTQSRVAGGGSRGDFGQPGAASGQRGSGNQRSRGQGRGLIR